MGLNDIHLIDNRQKHQASNNSIIQTSPIKYEMREDNNINLDPIQENLDDLNNMNEESLETINFNDEKKYLKPQSEYCRHLFARLALFLINVIAVSVIFISYFSNESYLDENSTLLCFFIFLAS